MYPSGSSYGCPMDMSRQAHQAADIPRDTGFTRRFRMTEAPLFTTIGGALFICIIIYLSWSQSTGVFAEYEIVQIDSRYCSFFARLYVKSDKC